MNGDEYSEFACPVELSTNDIYNIALKFYKENKDKAFHPTYGVRIKMSSLINFIKYGDYKNANISKELGLFDLVGKDIRKTWENLTITNVEDAQKEFIRTLEECCREFDGYLEAIFTKQMLEEEKRKEKEILEMKERELKEQQRQQDEEMRKRIYLENQRRIEQENRLRSLLNEQTLTQFKEYAAQQHPNDEREQERLISQLQQHHFHQYMLALYERSRKTSTNKEESSDNKQINDTPSNTNTNIEIETNEEKCTNNHSCKDDNVEETLEPNHINKIPAVSKSHSTSWYTPDMVEMWVSTDIQEFKSEFQTSTQIPDDGSPHPVSIGSNSDSSSDFVLKIGSGEVVTIQVPVNTATFKLKQSLKDQKNLNPDDHQAYLVWQFATDDNDIGFGLSVTRNTLSTHNYHHLNSLNNEEQSISETELVAVARRDSHIHMHGGRIRLLSNDSNDQTDDNSGDVSCVFLLRFDNSYSLWRHKWLYYRVCYSAN